MSKYSKIFFGQKEYYDIAPFRFPIYKDLVAGEIEGIEDVARKQAKNTYALLKIAKDIAERKDIPVQQALDALSDVNENQDILYDYVDQLAEIQTQRSIRKRTKDSNCDPVHAVQGRVQRAQ